MDEIIQVTESGNPKFKFMVREHARVWDTIIEVTENEACNFCQGTPITVVYRGWDDKLVTACKAHEEIVLEMMERDVA